MPSLGTWSLSREEIESSALSAWEDQEPETAETPPNVAHAVIDFTPHDEKIRRKIGRKLKAAAIKRGRMHP